MMNFAFKMMDFVSKGRRGGAAYSLQVNSFIKNDDLCIKNDEFCIRNDDFCIYNDEFCIENSVKWRRSRCCIIHSC